VVTNYKHMEFKLNALQKYSANVVLQLEQPALQLDKDLDILSVNDAFLKTFAINLQELRKTTFDVFIRDQWQNTALSELLGNCRSTAHGASDNFSLHGQRFQLSASPFVDEETGETLMILVTIKNSKTKK